MGSHGADARHLVGGDGYTKPSAADEEATVCLAILDKLGTFDGWVGVGGLVVRGVDADVDDLGDEGILLEGGFDGILVGDTGLVAGHDNTEGGRHCM